MENVNDFIAAARVGGIFVSGNGKTGFRVAVRNITTFKQVEAFANAKGATVRPSTRRFPELMHISFPDAE